jgi:VPDSG-CTERM motif
MNLSKLKSLCAIAIALVATGRFVSANLIVNPGFETGDFTGWTTTPAASGSNFGVHPNAAHSGTYGAGFLAVGTDLDAISQTFATTSGTLYDLSFWLANFNNGQTPDNEFRVTFGGVIVLDLIDSPDLLYTQFSFFGLATGSSMTLEFAGRNVPSAYLLDDVSVTPGAGVPDSGSTAMLFGLSATALLLARMRFRRIA